MAETLFRFLSKPYQYDEPARAIREAQEKSLADDRPILPSSRRDDWNAARGIT
jgi:hypothetical protein